jgi:uncharacterized damage-inducible protein DinB
VQKCKGVHEVWEDVEMASDGAMSAHFRRMALYNRWANARLYEAVGALSPEAFDAPRSGFFPSLSKTLNHLLVGDTIWMGRLDGSGHPNVTRLDQILHEDFAGLRAARAAMDERIITFVDRLDPARLDQDLVYRTIAGDPMVTPVGQVLAHVFNHQTHHRGQAHAMLSDAKVAPPSLDLILFLRDHSGTARAE